MPVWFFYEDISETIDNPLRTELWIRQVITHEKRVLGELNYILCSDAYLKKLNQDYLERDSFTDIITFDHSDTKAQIEGDIFISIERVRENAKTYNTGFNHELHRVLVHGVLHLIGLDDETEADKTRMREKEDACLSLWKN